MANSFSLEIDYKGCDVKMYYHTMQNQQNDCGIAVMRTILQQLGLKKVTTTNIRSCITEEINQGLSLLDLINVFEKFSVITEAYEVLDLDEILTISTPFIATISNNGLPHYIVVHQISNENIIISNPAKSGIENIKIEQFKETFSGYVVLIEKIRNLEVPNIQENKSNLKQFSDEIIKEIPIVDKLKVIVFTVLKLFIPILIILGFQYIMVFQIEKISNLDLGLMLIISISLLILYFIINIGNLKIRNKIEHSMQEKMVTDYFQGILKDNDFSVKSNSYLLGYFWNIIMSVPGIIQKFYFKIQFIVLVCFFVSLTFINLYMAVFSLIAFTCFSIAILIAYKKNYLFQKHFVMEVNQFSNTVTQLLNSLLDIKIFQKQPDAIDYLGSGINRYSNVKNDLKVAESKLMLWQDIFVYLIIIGGFSFYILSFMLNLNVTAPLFLFGLFLVFILANESKNIFNAFWEYQKSKVAIEYLQYRVNSNEVSKEKSELANYLLDEPIRDLQLKDISLKYEEKVVLERISVNLKAGNIVGLKGNNGSGKTSLMKIITGIVEPTSGKIIINNHDEFETVESNWMINRVMLYTPEYYIYNNTVKNNYDFNVFSEKSQSIVSEETVDFKLDYPDNFVVELDGKNISFGQKNKILLLRSMKVERDIYLLDEPSTGLDIKSTISLIESIKQLAKKNNKIVLIATHDPLLLDICDEIIDLDEQKLERVGISEEQFL